MNLSQFSETEQAADADRQSENRRSLLTVLERLAGRFNLPGPGEVEACLLFLSKDQSESKPAERSPESKTG